MDNPKTRRIFLKNWMLALVGSLLPGVSCHKNGSDILAILLKAGTSEHDEERLELLRQLVRSRDIQPTIREDIEKIMPYAEGWARNNKSDFSSSLPGAQNSYLLDFFNRDIAIDTIIPPSIDPASPVYPLWCLYRGRMLIWRTIEISWIRQVPDLRNQYYGEGRRLLKISHAAYQNNRIIGNYLDYPKPWPAMTATDDKAPAWANFQRELITKLRYIIHWWIDNRQLPDGQYGGGFNDDVEMWRHWMPILIGFDDQKVNEAQRLLSNTVLNSPRTNRGYHAQMMDVEHSSEETSDVLTPMLHLEPNGSFWQSRALKLIELFENIWTGRNEQNQLQFKSSYFTVDKVDISAPKAVDNFYSFRAMQPALLLWQRSRDPKLTDLFTDWLRTWVDASLRNERGKPAGITPTAIRWPDGKVGGYGKDWWKPENTHEPIYNWPGGIEYVLNSLLLAYHFTRDTYFLRPIFEQARIRREFLMTQDILPGDPDPGTLPWCASKLGKVLAGPLAKYRQISGDSQFDDLLHKDATPYVQYLLQNKLSTLEEGLKALNPAFLFHKDLYTSEVRYTDRILAFNSYYLDYFKPGPSARDIPPLLYSMYTGDPARGDYFPINAVRWLTPPGTLAALVNRIRKDQLLATLYNFEANNKKLDVELLLLDPGIYLLEISDDQGKILYTRTVEIDQIPYRIEFIMPSRKVIELSIQTK